MVRPLEEEEEEALGEPEDQAEEEQEPCPSLLLGLPSAAAALVWAELEDSSRAAREALLKASKHLAQVWCRQIASARVLIPQDTDVNAGYEVQTTALMRVCGANLRMRNLTLRRKLFTLQLTTPKCHSGEAKPTCQSALQAMVKQLAAAATQADGDANEDGPVAAPGAGDDGHAAAVQPAGDEEALAEEREPPAGDQQQQQEEQEGGSPQVQGRLDSVMCLNVQGFQLAGPSVASCLSSICRNLTAFEMTQCDLSGAFFTPLASLPALESLTLLHVSFLDADVGASLAALTSLTSLALDRVLTPAASALTMTKSQSVPEFSQQPRLSATGAPSSAPPPPLVLPGVAHLTQLRHLALQLHSRSPQTLDIAQLVQQLSHLSRLVTLKAWNLSQHRELDGPTATRLAECLPALGRLTLDRNVVVSGVRELLALRALTSLCARSLEPVEDQEGSLLGQPCSWQHLSLGAFCPSLTALANLPLHSLSAPFFLGELDLGGHPAAAQGDMESVALAVRHALSNCVHHCSTLTFTAGKLELVGTSAWGAPPLVDAWPALLSLDVLEEHCRRHEQGLAEAQRERQRRARNRADGMVAGTAAANGSQHEHEASTHTDQQQQHEQVLGLGQPVSHIKLVGLRVGQQEVAALATALGARITALTCTTCTVTPGALQSLVNQLPNLRRLGFGRKCVGCGLPALMQTLRNAQRKQMLTVCLTRPVGGRVATDNDLVATEADVHDCRQRLSDWGIDDKFEVQLGST